MFVVLTQFICLHVQFTNVTLWPCVDWQRRRGP